MCMSKILKQPGFSFGWNPVNVTPAVMEGEFYGPREWQTRAFKELKNAQFQILNAPGGSGKTWEICSL